MVASTIFLLAYLAKQENLVKMLLPVRISNASLAPITGKGPTGGMLPKDAGTMLPVRRLLTVPLASEQQTGHAQ